MAKRKRDEAGAKPTKKVAINAPAGAAKVSSLLQPKSSPPVIGKNRQERSTGSQGIILLTFGLIRRLATSPGITIPSGTTFQSYASQDQPMVRGRPSKKATSQRELLLHSTEHPNLDYTAKEEAGRGSEQLVNHYVAVVDPKTGSMQVIEAKKMVVRAAVRGKQAAEEEVAQKKLKQVSATARGLVFERGQLDLTRRETNTETDNPRP